MDVNYIEKKQLSSPVREERPKKITRRSTAAGESLSPASPLEKERNQDQENHVPLLAHNEAMDEFKTKESRLLRELDYHQSRKRDAEQKMDLLYQDLIQLRVQQQLSLVLEKLK
jgi:hypothetical protein